MFEKIDCRLRTWLNKTAYGSYYLPIDFTQFGASAITVKRYLRGEKIIPTRTISQGKNTIPLFDEVDFEKYSNVVRSAKVGRPSKLEEVVW